MDKHEYHKIQIREVCELLLKKGFSDNEIVSYLVEWLIPDRQLAANELFTVKVWMNYERRDQS